MARKMTFSGSKYKGEPVTEASKKKNTDVTKKAQAEKATPGTKLAKPGQSKSVAGNDMRATQIENAKKKAEAYKKKHGVYPTPANVKRFGSK